MQFALATGWRKAISAPGLKGFRWHNLRHTWASWLAMNGATLAELQELDGRKTGEMVRRYAHFSTQNLSKVSSKLDAILDVV